MIVQSGKFAKILLHVATRLLGSQAYVDYKNENDQQNANTESDQENVVTHDD